MPAPSRPHNRGRRGNDEATVQRDIQANEIDWVFCWRTSTGEVRPGARDTGMNGKAVLYQPSGARPEAGLRTIVRGDSSGLDSSRHRRVLRRCDKRGRSCASCAQIPT